MCVRTHDYTVLSIFHIDRKVNLNCPWSNSMENIGFLFYHYDENKNALKITPTFARVRSAPNMVLIGILGFSFQIP